MQIIRKPIIVVLKTSLGVIFEEAFELSLNLSGMGCQTNIGGLKRPPYGCFRHRYIKGAFSDHQDEKF